MSSLVIRDLIPAAFDSDASIVTDLTQFELSNTVGGTYYGSSYCAPCYSYPKKEHEYEEKEDKYDDDYGHKKNKKGSSCY